MCKYDVWADVIRLFVYQRVTEYQWMNEVQNEMLQTCYICVTFDECLNGV